MKEGNGFPRKKWDFMIGIALVLFGGFRLYRRIQVTSEWDYRMIITALFIVYGGFLIFRYLKK